MAISSCCEIWVRALRIWCLWILSFALSQKNRGNQWNIGQFYQDAWWGFMPAPLLFTHPSLQNRCSFGILSCSDVCASDTTLLGLLFTYRLFTSICASNMWDTQPALFFHIIIFQVNVKPSLKFNFQQTKKLRFPPHTVTWQRLWCLCVSRSWLTANIVKHNEVHWLKREPKWRLCAYCDELHGRELVNPGVQI